jgi:predicted amidohydrolase
MKVAVAQTHPIVGNMESNISRHLQFIGLAAANDADVIVFPELSLTGYEPTLAKELAVDPEDGRLEVFQELSNRSSIIIGVGVPTKVENGCCISMILFQPFLSRQYYHKKYLHVDEEPFFVSGTNAGGLMLGETDIALAICYEISVPEHAEDAFQEGAGIYLASVAKTGKGVEKAAERLAEISETYMMTAFMANCVGTCDGEICGGKSAIWNDEGQFLGQLDEDSEGLLIFDTETQEVSSKRLD